jgi:hypothetical protein
LEPKRLFKRCDAAGNRRLTDPHMPASGKCAAEIGNGEEIAQVVPVQHRSHFNE